MCVCGWRYITPQEEGINSKSSWTWGIFTERWGTLSQINEEHWQHLGRRWKFGVMGIRPNHSNYQDDICLKSNRSPTLGGDQKCLLIDHHYIRPFDSLWLVHSVIFHIISKNDAHCMYWSPIGESPGKPIDLLQWYGSSSRCQWSLCSSTSPIWTWLAFPQIARLAL